MERRSVEIKRQTMIRLEKERELMEERISQIKRQTDFDLQN